MITAFHIKSEVPPDPLSRLMGPILSASTSPQTKSFSIPTVRTENGSEDGQFDEFRVCIGQHQSAGQGAKDSPIFVECEEHARNRKVEERSDLLETTLRCNGRSRASNSTAEEGFESEEGTDVGESDDDADCDEYSSQGRPLEPFEYVIGKINIERSLATAFWIQSTYHDAPGTFPITSKEDVDAVWALIHEFRSQFGFPGESDGQIEQWKCPRFSPGSHLFFVNKVFRPKDGMYRAEIFPLLVDPVRTSAHGVLNTPDLKSGEYASIHPTNSPRSDYASLHTSPPLLPRSAVYQRVCSPEWCTIGAVKDGKKILLEAYMHGVLNEISSLAKQSLDVGFVDLPSVSDVLGCGCVPPAQHKRMKDTVFIHFQDIYLDFERLQDEMWLPTPGLTFSQEITRTVFLIDSFITWIRNRASYTLVAAEIFRTKTQK